MSEHRAQVEGVVEAISLQNINKAAGRYTYNVEVRVRWTRLAPVDEASWPWSEAQAPAVLTVRVQPRIYWSGLSDAERGQLAPDGPRHMLAVASLRGFVVGEAFAQEVAFTSVGLAHTTARRAGSGSNDDLF